jgi:hypothetical protein
MCDNCRQIKDAAHAREFLLGGNATVTIKSIKSGARHTFKVTRCDDDPSIYFVSRMTGSDNEADFHYLGLVRGVGMANEPEVFCHTRKSPPETSEPFRAFAWFFAHLVRRGELPAQLELWHEGRCCRCGRKLTVPESIESGVGPECSKKMARAA